VAVTDKIYLADHGRISAQLDAPISRRVFSGATLDVLYGGDALASLDDATRERLLDFAEDFLEGCDETALHSGVPERRFCHYLLERRAEGRDPDAIVSAMKADYGLYAYAGDIRSFLDDAVRTLDAAEALADVEGDTEQRDRLVSRREDLL
jgi:superfamily II helicase